MQMIYAAKGPFWGSVGFTPGFPSLSQFGCDPNAVDTPAACPLPPIVLGEQTAPFISGPAAIARAVAQGDAATNLSLAGCGCGCGGSCGCGDGLGGIFDSFSTITSDPMGWAQDHWPGIAVGVGLLFALVKLGMIRK